MAVGLHVCVNAAVAEDVTGGGQNGGVCTKAVTERAGPLVVNGRGPWRVRAALVLQQVEGGRGDRHGRERFDGALVVRGVPPFQELQEEDTQGEGGGERHGHTPGSL